MAFQVGTPRQLRHPPPTLFTLSNSVWHVLGQALGPWSWCSLPPTTSCPASPSTMPTCPPGLSVAITLSRKFLGTIQEDMWATLVLLGNWNIMVSFVPPTRGGAASYSIQPMNKKVVNPNILLLRRTNREYFQPKVVLWNYHVNHCRIE